MLPHHPGHLHSLAPALCPAATPLDPLSHTSFETSPAPVSRCSAYRCPETPGAPGRPVPSPNSPRPTLPSALLLCPSNSAGSFETASALLAAQRPRSAVRPPARPRWTLPRPTPSCIMGIAASSSKYCHWLPRHDPSLPLAASPGRRMFPPIRRFQKSCATRKPLGRASFEG